MDGKNTKTMILVAVVIAVIVCAAAAYYLLQDDEPQDGANHQTLDMPDTLLVIPAPGTGDPPARWGSACPTDWSRGRAPPPAPRR